MKMIKNIRENIAAILKDPIRLCMGIFLLAVAVRVAFALTLEDKWYFYDTKHYDAAARHLVRGEGFKLDYEFFGSTDYNLEPLYPLFLAANYALFGRHFITVRLVQALLGGLLCVLVFYIGRRSFGFWQGVVAAGICIFYPHLIFISGILYPEQLFTLLLAAGVLSLLRFEEQKRDAQLFGAALFFGAACLTKGILLAFFPFLALWMLLSGVGHTARNCRSIAIVLVVIVLLLLPWTYRNYRLTGTLAPVRAHTNVVLDETYADRDDALLTEFLSKKIGAGEFIRRYAGEFIRFWTPTLGRVKTDSEYKNSKTDLIAAAAALPVMLFALLGLCGASGRWRETLLFLCVLLSFALTYSLFITHVRYRIPVEPYLILLAGNGVIFARESLMRRFVRGQRR